MKLIEQFSVNNDCYQNNVHKADSRYVNFQNNGPKGLMLHSVGCPQPSAYVFARQWNQSGKQVAVHAVIQEDGTVIQCLRWNYRGWHCGGNANNTHIGVEMTEPDCIRYTGGAHFTCSNYDRARKQVAGTYKTAVELFAMLCKKYHLNPLGHNVIISHNEGNHLGLASNHADPEHLWNQLNMGYTMDGFRKDVKKAMSGDFEFPDDTKYINVLVDNNVINSPDYWVTAQYEVKYLDLLLESISKFVGPNEVSDIKTAEEAINHLYKNKVINSPDYWLDNYKKVKYLDLLLISSAKHIGEGFKSYNGKVTASVLNIRSGPSQNYAVVGQLKNGTICTIVDEDHGFGKLKSGEGWVSLDYIDKNCNEKPKQPTSKCPYVGRVTANILNIRSGPGTSYSVVGQIKDRGAYTIVSEENGFGKLKSGAGWVSLDYIEG